MSQALNNKTKLKSKIDYKKKYENFTSVPARIASYILRTIQENSAIVLGAAGHMGAGICDSLNRADILTLRTDISKELMDKAAKTIEKNQYKAAKYRKLAYKQLEKIKDRELIGQSYILEGKLPSLEGTPDKHIAAEEFVDKNIFHDVHALTNFKKALLFVEAGPENIEFKQNVFGFYTYALHDEAILATNTSSLTISDIAKKVPTPERVVGLHFFDPADRHPLIEVIAGPETSVETVLAMRDLAISMGKKPIVCWKDSPGAVANRILVGVLNESARMAEEGTEPSLIDKIFLKTFYSEQITVKLKSAQKQFEAAPKLAFFNDEKELYKKITKCDEKASKCRNEAEKEKIFSEKKEYMEEAIVKLNQKVLYATILENHASLGSFFKSPPSVGKLKTKAKTQLDKLKKHLSDFKSPSSIEPYDFFSSQDNNSSISEEEISNRLKGAYIAIAQEIYNEGLCTITDIELACKQGFYWNIGPFELIIKLGKEKASELTALINKNFSGKQKTGISKPGFVIDLKEHDLSGVQTYKQDNIGHIILGKLHIQYLQMTQNSLSIEMLTGIKDAIKTFEKDPEVKSVFISSQGGGPFSAGANLDYVSQMDWDSEKTTAYVQFGKSIIMNNIAKCSKPTIAIVDGLALGGGAELISACDYRIASFNAGVSFPEVNLVHIYPAWGGTETFPKIVGKKLAEAIMAPPIKKGLVILGAEDAYEVGFFDKLVLQSDIPHIKAALVENKVSGINIYSKTPKKENLAKDDYSVEIVKKYHLKKLKKAKWRLFSNSAASLTRKLIKNPSYEPSENELKNILKAGKFNAKVFIGFKLWFAKSKLAGFLK